VGSLPSTAGPQTGEQYDESLLMLLCALVSEIAKKLVFWVSPPFA